MKRVFRYLRDTIDDVLHFWRYNVQTELPNLPYPHILPDKYDVNLPTPVEQEPNVFVDSDWAGSTSHRRSISGMGLFFAASPVVYRSRFQSTVSTNSTEVEFIASAEASKLTLYLRSMLSDLGIAQESATRGHEDNEAAISMANAQCSTQRTCHMEIKIFALLDWVETYQIILSRISTHDNPADGLTKALGPQLFSRHSATLLEKRKPTYCKF